MYDLVLNVLGRIEMLRAGEPLVGFESDKVRALLIYLAVEADRPHRRRSLAGLLWPDAAEGVALGRLRQSLGNLRVVLGEDDAAPTLSIDRLNVRFNPERPPVVDSVTCLQNLDESRRHRHRDAFSCRFCRRRLEAVVGAYRGPFLDGFALGDGAGFDAWAEQQRQHLQTEVVEALFRLATAAERGGEVDEAIAFARRLLRIEPWREDAHRQLMRLFAHSDKRAAALHQYQICVHSLAEELGAEPEAETVALAERIRNGEYAGPKSSEPICRLPLPLSSFVGRRRELDELADLLSSERLLTLVGPGGSGKTRLAIEAARAMAGAFRDGAWFVDLAAITDPNLVVTATAAAFGIRRQGNRLLIDLLIEHLRGKRLLVVLDNAEHLVVACATLVRRLLGTCPELCVMATSREALQLLGESVWQVPPLGLPQRVEGGGDAVLAAESVQLFLDRAVGLDPNVQLDVSVRRAVGEICRRLEGIPLAIELAAARCAVLSPQALAARLDNRLNALGAGARDRPARQRTLRDTIAWSYGLLDDGEQALLRALAVFAGGFDAQAAIVVSGKDEWAVLDGLASLAAKSLLRKASEPDGEPRFGMLETIREFAREQLAAAGEMATMRRRHAKYFAGLAEAAEPELASPQAPGWIRRFILEHDNVRAALTWCVETGEAEPGMRLIGALWKWSFFEAPVEAREWTQALLTLPGAAAPTRARAWALLAAATGAWRQGDIDSERRHAEEALAIARDLDDERLLTLSLIWSGMVHYKDPDEARRRMVEAQRLAQARADLWMIGFVGLTGGMMLAHLSDYEAAGRWLGESIAVSRELHEEWLLGIALMVLSGTVTVAAGAWGQADAQLGEAKTLLLAAGDQRSAALVQMLQGGVALRRGAPELAQRHFLASLQTSEELGDEGNLASCLRGLAGVRLSEGQAEAAARLLGAARAVRERSGVSPRPYSEQVLAEVESNVRRALPAAAFARAEQSGFALGPQQAVTPAAPRASSEAGD